MIYLTKEDWNSLILPKLTENNSFNDQFSELSKIYSTMRIFIKQIYKHINQSEQSQLFMAAMTTFHKYRICSNFSLNKYSSEELYFILGACLFIGQKVTNILGHNLEDLSKYIRIIIQKKDPNKKVEKVYIKNKLKEREMEILINIGFNLDVDFNFPFFNKIKEYISKININADNFITLLNYFIKDSFILPISLYYTPNTVTISCVLLLKQKYNLKVINLSEIISLSEYKLDEREIQDCASIINKLEETITEKCKSQVNNKTTSNANTNTVNSTEASVTKIIPSIKMNIS